MIELAIATRIPMSEWEGAGLKAIATAYELLDEARRAEEKRG